MKKAFEIVTVSLIMTGLAMISTFPLVENFTTGIPWSAYRGDLRWSVLNHPGDHLQVFYFFWLVKQNLLGLVPFNANPYEFNMVGGLTAGNDGFTTAPLAFISFLCSPLGDIAAYNCTVIVSYVLAGVFMYLLARLITTSRTGAFLAAVMFTFIPIRINGLAGGNQYAFLLFMYPMIFYFMEKSIRDEKILFSILTGLGIIALSFNEPHLIYYLFLSLAGYLPVRFISLLPANNAIGLPGPLLIFSKRLSWPPWLSLFVIWGGGIAIVLYSHCVIPRWNDEAFFSTPFWWMIGYYPFIFLFLSIMLSSIYSHLSGKLFLKQGLAIEAVSILPLYIFVPLGFVFFEENPGTTEVIIYAVTAVVAIKLWLLKPHFLDITSHVWKHTKAMKRLLFVFSPALIGMAGTAVLTLINKTKSIAPSTESGGRTLHDVKLFSRHLEDLFNPTCSVHIGLIPLSFGVVFLCYLLYRAASNKKAWEENTPNLPVYTFVAFVLLLSQALAMGLALGNRSLYILFFHYVPFFNVPRVSERILCITILLLACVTAGVTNTIIHSFRARFWTICSSVMFLLLTAIQLKSYSVNEPMAITDLQPIEDGYQYIKDNIGDGVLLEIPLWPGDSHQSSIYEYYITLDKVKRVNGYTPLVSRDYIRTVFDPLHSMNRGTLDQEQYNLLRRLNVKYITVHEHNDIFPRKVSPYPPVTTGRRLTNSPYLEYIGPWDIRNKKYDKVHERLLIYRVKEEVSASEQNSYYPMPTIYRAGSRLLQKTGQVTFDSSIGRNVYNAVPGRDEPGALVYGPYASFFSGKYSVYFRIKCKGNSTQPAGRIEVVRFLGDTQEIIAAAELTGENLGETYQDHYLDFEIMRREQLEFRVTYLGTQEISLDKVVVTKKGNYGGKNLLEAEKMVGETGRIVRVQEASGHKVIVADPGVDRQGKLVFGPVMQYDKGDYSAFFRLRAFPPTDPNKAVNAVELSITGHQGRSEFARKMISSSDFHGEMFKRIRLDFTLAEAEEVDFSVLFTGTAAIQFDSIEIIRKANEEPL